MEEIIHFVQMTYLQLLTVIPADDLWGLLHNDNYYWLTEAGEREREKKRLSRAFQGQPISHPFRFTIVLNAFCLNTQRQALIAKLQKWNRIRESNILFCSSSSCMQVFPWNMCGVSPPSSTENYMKNWFLSMEQKIASWMSVVYWTLQVQCSLQVVSVL